MSVQINCSDAWLSVPLQRPQAKMRLFCLPYAGGGMAPYRQWPTYLPTQVEICLVHLPGREQRVLEAPIANMNQLIRTLCAALIPHLDRPFALFGYSMGALISFEVIRYLRKQGHMPVHFFASAAHAPQLVRKDRGWRNLPDEDLIERLRWLNGTPTQLLSDPALLRYFLPLIRADLTLCETYRYLEEEPFECSITAFGGMQDPSVSQGDLCSWHVQTHAAFHLKMVPGDHFFIHTYQQQLWRGLSEELALLLSSSAI